MTGKRLCKLLSLALLLALFPLVAAGATAWSEPVKVSGGAVYVHSPQLWIGPDGRQAAFWIQQTTSPGRKSLWSSVRAPGQAWTEPSNLSGDMDGYYLGDDYLSTGLAPHGTAWALWSQADESLASDNMQVWAAWLTPGGRLAEGHAVRRVRDRHPLLAAGNRAGGRPGGGMGGLRRPHSRL